MWPEAAAVRPQVPLPPSPPPAWGGLGAPPTDIERFMSLATPLLPLKDPGQLKLVRMPANHGPRPDRLSALDFLWPRRFSLGCDYSGLDMVGKCERAALIHHVDKTHF